MTILAAHHKVTGKIQFYLMTETLKLAGYSVAIY
jgi:hypothetical protein